MIKQTEIPIENKENGQSGKEEVKFITFLDGTKEPIAATVKLSDGRIAKIAKAKGKHVMRVQKLVASLDKRESAEEMYFPMLFSLLVIVDDKFLSPEDFADMSMKDYNAILVEFTGINF